MKKTRVIAFVMLVVLAVSFSTCALADNKSYSFNLRAVSNGITGYKGSKSDDETNFYVTQTSATPASDISDAGWKTIYCSVWNSTGVVASNSVTLESNTTGHNSYTDSVKKGDTFKLKINLVVPDPYSNVYFTIGGRWTP